MKRKQYEESGRQVLDDISIPKIDPFNLVQVQATGEPENENTGNYTGIPSATLVTYVDNIAQHE